MTRGTWVVEITGYDIVGAVDRTFLFSWGGAVAFTDHAPAKSGLLQWKSPTQKIDIAATGKPTSSADSGEIIIANLPSDITVAGPWDALTGYAFQGRTATLYWVPGRVWADKVLTATGVLEQPVASLAAGGSIDSSLRFPIRDPRGGLNAPLQPEKYGGTNVAPNGVDGAADLKGTPRPILIGLASNFTGRRVNDQKLIYELHCGEAEVLCVRDGAIPLTAGTQRANVASLQSNSPPPGGYDYVQSASEGTFVRLGSTPVYRLAFDAREGGSSAARTHAQVWKRLRTTYCDTDAGDIDSASVTAVDALDSEEIGFWFGDEISRKDAIDRIMASLFGYEVQDLDGDWHIGRLDAPSGSPELRIVLLTPSTDLKADDRALISLERARPAYQPNGSPPYRVNVRWGFNNTVMSPSDFAGGCSERLRDKFATAWRVETATDTDIWDPSDGSGAFPNAPELTIDTGYQPGADGLTCPHAATRASDLLDLLSPLKGQYQARFLAQPGDVVLPGAVVDLVYPGQGLSSGASFVVLQSAWVVKDREPEVVLVLGLQT